MRRILTTCLFCFPLLVYSAPIPDLEYRDLVGNTHKISDYQGKWVIVNYWATWCPPCMDEIPELVEFHETYSRDRAVVLGVNFDETDVKYLAKFSDEFFITYPVLVVDQRNPQFLRDIFVVPTTFIISPDGELIATEMGEVDKATLESYMNDYEKQKEANAK